MKYAKFYQIEDDDLFQVEFADDDPALITAIKNGKCVQDKPFEHTPIKSRYRSKRHPELKIWYPKDVDMDGNPAP